MSGSPHPTSVAVPELLTVSASSVAEEMRVRVRARRSEGAELTEAQRYALDPFLLLSESTFRIFDKRTNLPTRLELFDLQRDFVEAWIDLELLRAEGICKFRNVVEEKSRQLGLTWTAAYCIWWAVTFHPINGLAIAEKAEDVDDGGAENTWRSVFGKVRYLETHCDDFPGRGDLRFWPKSASRPARIQNRLRPDSFVIAGAQTLNPGRGGTFGFVLVDEAAHVPWGERVHQSIRSACENGRAYVSTPLGDSNVHARLATNPPAGYVSLRAHWSDYPPYAEGLHVAGELDTCELCVGTNTDGVEWSPADPKCHRYPNRLTSDWYEAAIVDMTDEQVAAELELDRSASLPHRVFPEWSKRLHVHHSPIPFDTHLPVVGCIDYGLDATAIAFCQDAPQEFLVIGEVEISDATPDIVALAMREELVRIGVDFDPFDPSWSRRIRMLGDPSGEHRSVLTSTSLVDEYALEGFGISSPRVRSVQTQIGSVKRLMRGLPKPLVVSPDCSRFIRHMGATRWPTDKAGNRTGATAPVDDEHGHMPAAFRYLISELFPLPRKAADAPLESDPPAGRALQRRRAIRAGRLRRGQTL